MLSYFEGSLRIFAACLQLQLFTVLLIKCTTQVVYFLKRNNASSTCLISFAGLPVTIVLHNLQNFGSYFTAYINSHSRLLTAVHLVNVADPTDPEFAFGATCRPNCNCSADHPHDYFGSNCEKF
jgi:hypothetical protein